MASVFVIVYDNKQDINEEIGGCCFWVDRTKLDAFLEICKENNKYVTIELDFSEEK